MECLFAIRFSQRLIVLVDAGEYLLQIEFIHAHVEYADIAFLNVLKKGTVESSFDHHGK